METTLQAQIDRALAGKPRRHKPVPYAAYTAPAGEKLHRGEILKRLPHLPRAGSADNRLHIGVAGFFNFEMACTTRPSAILLLDSNPVQRVMFEGVGEILKQAATPDMFKDVYLDWVQRLPISGEERMHEMSYILSRPAWLQPQHYAYVRDLALRGRIVSAELDVVSDGERAQALGQCLQQQGLVTDSCYWSNLKDFIGVANAEVKFIGSEGAALGDHVHYESVRYRVWKPYPGPTEWNGEERRPSRWHELGEKTRPRKPSELPPFENMLRNMSAIGGPTGFHFLTTNEGQEKEADRPLIMTEGPPRHLARLAAKRAQPPSSDIAERK